MMAPPARSSMAALARWSWSSAWGNGTRMAGRPMAASSATVEAPDRLTTRRLLAMGAGTEAKNAAPPEILVARLLGDEQLAPQRDRHQLDPRRHDVGHDAGALAAAEHQKIERP